MKPVLFVIPFPGIGGLPVRSYGFMVMLGCLAAIFVALRRAKREGVDRNVVWDVWMWALIGGFVGARAFYVALFWPQFKDNLVSILYIWEGGLAFQGGLIMAVLCAYAYLKIRRLEAARYFDMVAAAVILGYGFARVGCFLNGCCHGRPTTEPWAVTYPAAAPAFANGGLRTSPAWDAQVMGVPHRIPDDVAALPSCQGRVHDGRLDDTWRERQLLGATAADAPMPRTCPIHPTQLYSTGYALIIFAILLLYARMPHHHGQEVSLFGALYAIARFTVEFFRGDALAPYAGLTIFQVTCLGLFVFFAALWVWCQYKMPAYQKPAGR
jgi:phosphatidylglycerol---prolipoprotein diacylglyceryl transferase